MASENGRELVVLRVDNTPAEDESYIVGAVFLPHGHDLEEDGHADRISNLYAEWLEQAKQDGESPEDNAFLKHLGQCGYEMAPVPSILDLGR